MINTDLETKTYPNFAIYLCFKVFHSAPEVCLFLDSGKWLLLLYILWYGSAEDSCVVIQ
jgi:hypothetical protein